MTEQPGSAVAASADEAAVERSRDEAIESLHRTRKCIVNLLVAAKKEPDPVNRSAPIVRLLTFLNSVEILIAGNSDDATLAGVGLTAAARACADPSTFSDTMRLAELAVMKASEQVN